MSSSTEVFTKPGIALIKKKGSGLHMPSPDFLELPDLTVNLTPQGDLQITDYTNNEKHLRQLISNLKELGIETEFQTRGWCA